MRNIKADEKLLQNGRTSCRPRTGDRTSIGSSGDEAEGDGGLQFPTAPSMGEAAGTRIVLLVAAPKNGVAEVRRRTGKRFPSTYLSLPEFSSGDRNGGR